MPIAAIRSEGGRGASVDRRSAPAAKTVSAVRERGAMLVAQKGEPSKSSWSWTFRAVR